MPAFSAPLHVRDNVPLPSVRLPAIATMCRLHAQDVAPLSHVHARRGRRIHAVRELWQGNRLARTKMPLCWQDVANMRSQALADGKMLAKCVPGRQSVASFALHASQKWLRTGKSPVRGSILPPCIQNELAMAGYARYVSEKPRKPPFGNARREDLARKGSFRCTGPSNHARRANLAIL